MYLFNALYGNFSPINLLTQICELARTVISARISTKEDPILPQKVVSAKFAEIPTNAAKKEFLRMILSFPKGKSVCNTIIWS